MENPRFHLYVYGAPTCGGCICHCGLNFVLMTTITINAIKFIKCNC